MQRESRSGTHACFFTRSISVTALENAASIAGLLLTMEAMVVELPEPKAAVPAGGYGGMDGGY